MKGRKLMAELTSPINGKVWKILVAVGDKVELDDEMVILEALKMETPIYSEENGTVSEIRVKEGDAVNEGDVLVVVT
ncbi:MAG: acetyl-CoA carboxylase biotin carboxyl carrier protein subunit [Desulfuromonadaceae bacterium]|nr:acetyl-CoA carboxylase biotin carboxyl carrier protein subunit [Desulfuromonadaceae bacterium]